MESRRIRIKTGEETRKYITDSEANAMINHLGELMRNIEYYNAWIKLIDDIDYYRNKNLNNTLVANFGGLLLIIIILALILGKKDSSDSSNYNYSYSGFSGGGGGGGATGGW